MYAFLYWAIFVTAGCGSNSGGQDADTAETRPVSDGDHEVFLQDGDTDHTDSDLEGDEGVTETCLSTGNACCDSCRHGTAEPQFDGDCPDQVCCGACGFTPVDEHIVTQAGAGADEMSVDEFNALGGTDYAGHAFYFQGPFETTVEVCIEGDGPSGPVILDGLRAGNCDPFADQCAGAAELNAGMKVGGTCHNSAGPDYVVIQDMIITNRGTGLYVAGNNHWNGTYMERIGTDDQRSVDNNIIRRNYIHHTDGTMLYYWGGKNVIIEDNVCLHYGQNGSDAVQGINFIEMENFLVRHNEFGHDDYAFPSGCTSANVVELHTSRNGLFEYNDIYGSVGHPAAGIAMKEPGEVRNIIFRFNKTHDNGRPEQGSVGVSWGGGPASHGNLYCYCNLSYNNKIGMQAHDNGDDSYWWSNVIINNENSGFNTWGRDGDSPDNTRIFNNTIVNNGDTDWNDRSGFGFSDGHQREVQNNVAYNNRPSGYDSKYYQYYSSGGSVAILDYNTYFHPAGGEENLWHFYPTTQDWDSVQESGYEMNSDIRDPLFVNPTFDDINGYSLQDGSSDIDDGENLSQTFSVELSGGDVWFEEETGYGTVTVETGTALHPDTDWSQFPSPESIVTANQNDCGFGWERGAYVYDDGSPACEP